MNKKLHLILFLFFSIATTAAQEICNNGIDDDGNGFVDCYDSQCNGNADCSDFFFGKPIVNCSTNPTNPAFDLNVIWQSTVDVSSRSTMMVGDVDADGIPEVVCHQSGVNELYILDGITGAVEVTINCPAIADHVDAIAIGDTDDDGLAEIYVVTNDNVLRCFENDGTPKVGYTPVATGGTNESIPGIADFNGDGIPELYKDNRIYHSLTGALIASGTGSTGNNPGSNGSPAAMPVAADVLPDNYCANCAGLELVCGNVVYAVDISGGTLTPIANSLPGALADGFTSIADIDVDGQLDIVIVSNGTIYVWDPRTGLQMGNTFNIPNTSAGGRANIADYDNDGLPEIGAGGMNRYVVIDIDTATNALSQKWIKTIVDGSQHTTGSVFDFDCDGKAQVVYRDENNLYVWDGETGTETASIPCGSGTRSEFPTIVDVDGDGQVNIVCACAPSNGGAAGKVMAFNSSTNQWVGSRTVMNQHSYFVTNVNDDLSIPTQQQNQALLPKINGFQAQSPIYDLNWNSSCIPLADVTITIDSVMYCQKPDSVLVILNLCNIGSKVTTAPLNLSVYNGDPLSGGSLINTVSLTTLVYADTCATDTIAVPFTGTSATLYIYANDNGTNPSAAPETNFIECDSSNNFDIATITIPMVLVEVSGDTIICSGESTILTVIGGDSYQWSPATGLNATSGSTITANPTLTTTYTITGLDSTSGCDNFTTVTITVNPKPDAVFGSTTVCQGLATQFTDTSITTTGTITSWIWAFGDGDSISGNAQPAHLYDSAGNYTAVLIAGNNFGCADTLSKQVQVNYNAFAGFTHTDVCIMDTMQFTNTSSIHSSASITSYSWNFGDGSPPDTLLNPQHFYTTAGNYTVKLIVNANNGCLDSISNTVNVFAPPVAAFTVNNTCSSDSAIFTNTSTNPINASIGTWQWSFGDGSAVNTATWSPGHLYASAGVYQVTLITSSSNLGCADTITDSVTVFPLPLANFGVEDVCMTASTVFSDSSAILNGTITGWVWNFGDNTGSSTLQNPTYTYNTFGMFACTLIVTSNNGCKDTIIKNTIVHPLPDAQFSADNPCEGETVNFTDISGIQTNSTNDLLQYWFWDFDDNTPPATTQNPGHLYNSVGAYDVQMLVVTDFGCMDSIQKTIVVNPNPVALFNANDTSGCSPLCISLQSTSFVNNGNIAGWLWDFGDGSIPTSSQDALHCYTNSTSNPLFFSPSLTVTSDSGCVSILTKNNYMNVFPQPTAEFLVTPQITTILEPIVSIVNSSTIATSWNWNFGDLQTSTLEQPPYHEYADTGNYQITLIASTQYNCSDTAYHTVIIEPEFQFYIPNAFTPNEDGINDSFSGKGIFIKEYEMLIYNRWGNLIYETQSIDKPWNGIANNGTEIALQDVYVYYISVTDFKDVKHKFRGIVTLVR